MEDVADVGLVDAEAEGVGGDHHRALAAPHVAPLLGGPLGGVHAAVVAMDRDSETLEEGPQHVHLAPRGAVDDAGAT